MTLKGKFFAVFKAKKKVFLVKKGKEKRIVFADNLDHAKQKYCDKYWNFKEINPLMAFIKVW